jgi:hypothetical protein
MELADIRLQNALLLRDHFGRKWRAEGDERARTLDTSFGSLGTGRIKTTIGVANASCITSEKSCDPSRC